MMKMKDVDVGAPVDVVDAPVDVVAPVDVSDPVDVDVPVDGAPVVVFDVACSNVSVHCESTLQSQASLLLVSITLQFGQVPETLKATMYLPSGGLLPQ